MEIKGKCIAVLPVTTGQGKNGEWQSQDFVIETFDQYPKKVCINAFNERIKFIPRIDEFVNVSFDIESREYNGRWFTTARAWKIEKDGATPVQQTPAQTQTAPPATETDLPF